MSNDALISDLALLLNAGRWLNVGQVLGPDAGAAMDRILKKLDVNWNKHYQRYGNAYGATEAALRELLYRVT